MEAIQDNGTFQSSEELLRDGIAPQQVMSNLIIGKTLQESTEMAEQLIDAHVLLNTRWRECAGRTADR